MTYQKKSILLVDDDEMILELGRLMFQANGFDILIARNGNEAIKLFEKNASCFTLILTDYDMPHMKGNELAIKIHQINNNIPIILTTGNQAITKQHLQKWGIQDIIYKPYPFHQILNKVRNLNPPGILNNL